MKPKEKLKVAKVAKCVRGKIMSSETKTKCDNCWREFNTDASIPQYGIKVLPNDYRIKNSCGVEHDVYVFPPIEKNLDFCGLLCLKEWANKNT